MVSGTPFVGRGGDRGVPGAIAVRGASGARCKLGTRAVPAEGPHGRCTTQLRRPRDICGLSMRLCQLAWRIRHRTAQVPSAPHTCVSWSGAMWRLCGAARSLDTTSAGCSRARAVAMLSLAPVASCVACAMGSKRWCGRLNSLSLCRTRFAQTGLINCTKTATAETREAMEDQRGRPRSRKPTHARPRIMEKVSFYKI